MATRVATRSARQPPKVLPPSSPFGELLRRSNFASYDPTIRQTYVAPASYVHRGNWGLKRPISNRKRHSAIVLRNFEEHAHYIEWDKAPAQVDFIKRVEELNIQPTLAPNTPWSMSLGPNADLIDSDFCPQTKKKTSKAKTVAPSGSTPSPPQPTPTEEAAHPPPQIKPRGYRSTYSRLVKIDTKAPVPVDEGETYIQPNIAAMTPRQFEQYIEELRELRPEFIKYIKQEIKARRGPNDSHTLDPDVIQSDEEIMLEFASEATEKSLHRHFLGKHNQTKFDSYKVAAKNQKAASVAAAAAAANEAQPIQGIPHKLGGLLYSKPTSLETFFSGHAEPGLIVQEMNNAAYFHKSRDNGYIAAFAGLSARLGKDAAGPGAAALFSPFTEEGLDAPLVPKADGTGSTIDMDKSVRDMRMIELLLEAPPKVVGHNVSNKSMLGVHVDATVVANDGFSQNSRSNPYKPGSRQFNGLSSKDMQPGSWNPLNPNVRARTQSRPRYPSVGQSTPEPTSESGKVKAMNVEMLLALSSRSRR